MNKRIIPNDVVRVQIEAADPETSAFVAANAGSGKTHVLAQRVINLLLRGVDPSTILCITFTKAAAANMANRVFGWLAEWSTLEDEALDEKIGQSTGKRPDAAQRARARRLFASALETPGGLKVQTIHAFCTRLLHQFPFEANVGAAFSVLDEATTQELLDRLTLDVLLEASARPESALGKALATAIVVAADQTFKDVIGDAIRKRDKISEWIERCGSVEAAIDGLSRTLDIDPDDNQDRVERDYFAQSFIPENEWPDLIAVLQSGSKTDRDKADALVVIRTRYGRERIDGYVQIFCTQKLEPRKTIVTKKVTEEYPEWSERLVREQSRIMDLIALERAIAARDRTRALIVIAAEVIKRYAREKEKRALLDYDDLIDRTLDIFRNASAAWVLYKLDLGIDHVLVDEAQDTSPKQWEIIQTIVSEFTAGGARPNVRRTLFAVGDEKQSIFSFQGAEPYAFDKMRRHFEHQFSSEKQGWKFLRFRRSFRSGDSVLGSVDRVFKEQEIYVSVTTDQDGIPEHLSLPKTAPGIVEIWGLVEPAPKKEVEGWDAPFDTESEESTRVRLAGRIAGQVGSWIDEGLRPSDVLVLVRQRGPLFEAIIRALKYAGIPVAGADRLVLTEHIAVMDLMALADCLLLPDDDLSLASVLKSPLFGLSEEQLFSLAYNRKGTLRQALKQNPDFITTAKTIELLSDTARQLTPFAFFSHVLGGLQGRAKILKRLGPEANDALDEFLNLALDFETRQTPSLQGFVAWLRMAQSEVRRDMEIDRDEVRVMTVHGAKGLEAKAVILADTTTKPTGPHDPPLLSLVNHEIVWASTTSNDVGSMSDARIRNQEAARDEYRRLLYVAMTRAAERLIICGVKGEHKIPDDCWYQLIEKTLKDECQIEKGFDGEDVWRYRKGNTSSSPEPSPDKNAKALSQTNEIPRWLTIRAPTERPILLTITPSSNHDSGPHTMGTSDGHALLRGTLVHRLLQSLPDIPVKRRRKAIEDYLDRAGQDLSGDERQRLQERVLQIIEQTDFQELFVSGSRAEVPIIGKINGPKEKLLVSGRIDRMTVTLETVLIADYKTDRHPPKRVEETPAAYLQQLALYRAVLAKLYPDKRIRAALVWTESLEFMEISETLLDHAFSQITSTRSRLDAAGHRS